MGTGGCWCTLPHVNISIDVSSMRYPAGMRILQGFQVPSRTHEANVRLDVVGHRMSPSLVNLICIASG